MHALKSLTIGMQELTGMLASKPWNHDQIEAIRQVPLKVEGAPRIIDWLPNNLEYLMIHSVVGSQSSTRSSSWFMPWHKVTGSITCAIWE